MAYAELADRIKKEFPDLNVSSSVFEQHCPTFFKNFVIVALLAFDVDVEKVMTVQVEQSSDDESESMIPIINLMCAVKKIFLISEIGLFDFLSPVTNRMVYICDEMMEYLEFADKKASELYEKADSYFKLKERLHNSRKIQNNLAEKENDFQLGLYDEEQQKKDLWKKFEEKNKILNELMTEKRNFESELSSKETELKGFESKKIGSINQLGKLSFEIEKLRISASSDANVSSGCLESEEFLEEEKKDSSEKKARLWELLNSKLADTARHDEMLAQWTELLKSAEDLKIQVDKYENTLSTIKQLKKNDYDEVEKRLNKLSKLEKEIESTKEERHNSSELLKKDIINLRGNERDYNLKEKDLLKETKVIEGFVELILQENCLTKMINDEYLQCVDQYKREEETLSTKEGNLKLQTIQVLTEIKNKREQERDQLKTRKDVLSEKYKKYL